MSSPRRTLAAVGTAAVLALAIWGWSTKIKPAREKAAEDAKRPFAGLKPGDTGEILLRKKGSPDVLLRKVDGDWKLITPIKAPADAVAVQALVQALSDASREEVVVEKDAELRQYGLDDPSGAVTFKPVSAGAKAGVLFFGNDNPTGSYAYAMVDGQPQVFLTWLSVKSALLKDADSLRDKAVWAFGSAEVKEARSSQDGGFVVARDANGGWTVRDHGQEEPGRGAAIESWLGELAGLKATHVPSEDGKGGAWGLAAKDHLDLLLIDGSHRKLRLGAKAKDGGFYAGAGPGSPVFELLDGARSTLEKGPKDLADRQAYSLDPQQVERFEVKRPEGALSAAKTNGKWAWTKGVADTNAAYDFDAFLSRFQGAQLLKRLTQKDKPDKVDRGVYFYGPSGALLESAEFGRKRDGGVLSVSGSKRLVSVVADNLMDSLPPGLTRTAK